MTPVPAAGACPDTARAQLITDRATTQARARNIYGSILEVAFQSVAGLKTAIRILHFAMRALSSIQLSPRVQLIEVQQCVEDQEIAALRLAAPDRIVREGDDVSL